ncbi:hypothetical protein [Actinacidiphila bryophytorum]|uniref:Uncharacterized protein n=1 Tax=Actinacidiphila bryophytorum TaxID=1436133 RepID=A0A9W4H7U9_9ACTN|nr:hypothetical protein [Actinacidiphila bryophytorum]MBM9437743.1 hypothetical protein [Actinacidiphila bryophytorum]CAG7656808.1 conserved hypothetical protein [Actinacidiphila bryophytorum]
MIAVIWFVATRLRSADDVRNREVAARGTDAQEETNQKLSDVQAQLADMNQRLTQVQRILQDAE